MSRADTLLTAEKLVGIYLETMRPLFSWNEIKRLFRAVIAERLALQIETHDITKSALARQLGVSRPTLEALLEDVDRKPTGQTPTTNFPAVVFLLLQRSGDRGMTREQLRVAYHRHCFEACDNENIPENIHPQEGKFGEALCQLVNEGRARADQGRYWALDSKRDMIPQQETLENLQTKIVSFASIALGICRYIKKQQGITGDRIRRRILSVANDEDFIEEMSQELEEMLSRFCDHWEARAQEYAEIHGEGCLTSHVFVFASGNGPQHAPDCK